MDKRHADGFQGVDWINVLPFFFLHISKTPHTHKGQWKIVLYSLIYMVWKRTSIVNRFYFFLIYPNDSFIDQEAIFIILPMKICTKCQNLSRSTNDLLWIIALGIPYVTNKLKKEKKALVHFLFSASFELHQKQKVTPLLHASFYWDLS